jgi:hypothetical protein
VQVESLREMARSMADVPMRDLEEMIRAIGQVALEAGSFGAFGTMGGSLGDAFEEVRLAALKYLAAKRAQVSEIHNKAYDSSNTYLDGDGQAAQKAADLTNIKT